MYILVVIAFGILSWAMTGVLRRYAVSRRLIDVPNVRSSHTVPTPRGGGISIVASFLLGMVVLWAMSVLDDSVFIALSVSSLLVAVIGFVDDHGHIDARWRLLGHFIAAIWLVAWLGGLPPLGVFENTIDLGWVGHVLACVALVWLLNLYNFMDGIDGIAAIEAITATIVVSVVLLLKTESGGLPLLCLLVSSAVAGFLIWNIPPAKIFMGDVGSGFLGLILGGVGLYSVHFDPTLLWVWMIMLGIFIVDATYTLMRRLIRREKVYEAHRSHAYQYASRKYGSHMVVSLSVMFINLFWLAPWSFLVAFGLVDGVVGLAVSYIPLLGLAWYYRAGETESST